MESSPTSVPPIHYDAVVVGAGPYGLSTAAHLLGRGLNVAVFGKTAEFWRRHMPHGMLLRSHWWATNLSDPDGAYGFDRYFRACKTSKKCYPLPREAFIDYASWFQEHAVPCVDETYVAAVEHQGDHFLLTLEDGRKAKSASVVMAIGLHYYADRPVPYDRLPAGLVSHSSEHNDLSRFNGRCVIVIGGGQSAVEYAALLHEAGATVHLVSRRPIFWLPADRAGQRSALERILAPTASISPGWQSWVLEHSPYLLYRFPQESKDRCNRSYCTASASDWLRDRVIGRVARHEGQTVAAWDVADGKVHARISGGEEVSADHVILATGYRVDVARLTMIHPSLLAEIQTEMATPVLSSSFESSVPGLYFVGVTSMRAFGPLYRFVAGCKAAAPRVAAGVARRRIDRPGVGAVQWPGREDRAAEVSRANAPSFLGYGAGSVDEPSV